MATRYENLKQEISNFEDAIMYGKMKEKNVGKAEKILQRTKILFEQGSWGSAERLVEKLSIFKKSSWFVDFVEKRNANGMKAFSKDNKTVVRFVGDGLCDKYGHLMVKVQLSNVRWFYQCRICKKRGKFRSIR